MKAHLEHKLLSVRRYTCTPPIHITLGDILLRKCEVCWERRGSARGCERILTDSARKGNRKEAVVNYNLNKN